MTNYHTYNANLASLLQAQGPVDLMTTMRLLHERNRLDKQIFSTSSGTRFSGMTWNEIVRDNRSRFSNMLLHFKSVRNDGEHYTHTAFSFHSRMLRRYFETLASFYPSLLPGYNAWINWREVLEHDDYKFHASSGAAKLASRKNADQLKSIHALRVELSRNSRGHTSSFSDGSTIHFRARTYQDRWPNDLRLVFSGAQARALMVELRMPTRCVTCNKHACNCSCVWLEEDGSHYWREPLPPIRPGNSALSMRSHDIVMQGKVGLAVGVELELHTVKRGNAVQLSDFLLENLITRKPDGSTGVAVELCTPPMRQDVATDVLAKLHDLLRYNDAKASLGCGLHVHVDGTGLDRVSVDRLLTLWTTYGSRVWDALPDIRKNNEYCRDTTEWEHDVEYYGNRLTTGGDRDNSNRYLDLNLENLKLYSKTVEFRLFPAYSSNPDDYDACDNVYDVPLITKDQLLSCVAVSREFVKAAIVNETTTLLSAIAKLERTF